MKTLTDIGTITLPEGTYLVVSYINLNKVGTGSYNHHVGGPISGTRIVRSTELNGGGSCNVAIFAGNQTVTVQVYTNTVDAVTVSGMINAIKL